MRIHSDKLMPNDFHAATHAAGMRGVRATVTQLAALTDLYRIGAQWPTDRRRPGLAPHRYSRRTLDALVTAGLAQWSTYDPNYLQMPHVLPAGEPWEVDHLWHVMVPDTLDSAAVARAIILGKQRARSVVWERAGWHPRVTLVEHLPYVHHYREV